LANKTLPEILKGGRHPKPQPYRRNSRVIIDACIPFRRKKTFPVIARSSKALDDRIREKWAKDLPKGF
jgi:hypothetical protein